MNYKIKRDCKECKSFNNNTDSCDNEDSNNYGKIVIHSYGCDKFNSDPVGEDVAHSIPTGEIKS